MGLWSFVRPEATVNLVSNPSLETGVTGYINPPGTAIARVSTEQAVGLYSLAVTPSADVADGAFFALTLSTTTTYTFGVSVKGANGVDYGVIFYDVTALAVLGTPVGFTGDGTWRRQVVSATTGANTSYWVGVVKNNNASTATYYMDALQVEEKAYATTYCDGSQEGCIWAAGAHSSTSSRDAESAKGGRIIDLDSDDYGFDVDATIGTGMPPVELIDTLPAQSDGADHQRAIVRPRQFQLVGTIGGADRSEWHTHRQNLIEAFNAHRLATDEAIRLRYTWDNRSVQIAARYEGGLEKAKQEGPAVEEIGLRFKAQEDAFWYNAAGVANGSGGGGSTASGGSGGGQGVIPPGAGQQNVANADYILMQDALGQWAEMDGGVSLPVPGVANSSIFAVAQNPVTGYIYIGGQFTSVGGVALTANIAEWDGMNWNSVVGAFTGAPIYIQDIIFDSNGMMYVAGQFSAINGDTNAKGIAKYDYTTGTWSALGTGIASAQVQSMIFNEDETALYIGGSFPLAGGVANTVRVAKWTVGTSTWSALGTGVPNNTVYGVALDSNEDLYICGSFTNAGGVASADYFAKWDGAWNGLGTPPNNEVQDLVVQLSTDDVFLVGLFTSAGGIANTNKIAKWNGSAYESVGGGADTNLNAIAQDTLGNIYVGGGGPIKTALPNTLGVAKWNNTEWSALGTGTNNPVHDLYFCISGALLIGGTFTSAGGVANTTYLAWWTGAGYRTIATPIKEILQATDGKIYIAGGFINAGGVANADSICYFDPSTATLNALSTGANGVVHCIAEAPNGDIYIGGSFPLAGGVANTVGIAYWDISASVWLPLSTGVDDGVVLSLAFAPNGDLYIGGIFEGLGGVANTRHLGMWDGSTFNALSDEPDAAVNILRFNSSGKLFVGGAFKKIGSITYDYISQYDPDDDTFEVLQTGTNGFVNDLAFGPDGSLYLTGTFKQAGSTDNVNYVARWTGTMFLGLGSGLNGIGYVIRVDKDGQVWVGGAFTEAGGITLPDKVAIWGGATWAPIDVNLPGDAAVEAILVANTITVLGFDTSGTAVAAEIN